MRSCRARLNLLYLVLVFLICVPEHRVSAAWPTDLHPAPEAVQFRIDPARSKFMVIAPRSGLAWFKGHSHYLAVLDFSGSAELTLDQLTPATLEMSVRTASIEETGADFTAEQKATIKKELDELVLESAKFPEILFKSTKVSGKFAAGSFDVRITGDLSLHGVSRQIEIPATVSVDGDVLHAKGEFKLDRTKFNVKATDAFHGLVRVSHTLRFTFDIIATRV